MPDTNLVTDPGFQQVQHVLITATNAGQRIDNFLFGLMKTVPRGVIYRMMRTGQVRVNKKRVKPPFKLSTGDDVRIPPVTIKQEDPASLPGGMIRRIEQSVIYSDNRWVVINKPAGISVHQGTGIRFGAVDLVRAVFGEPQIALVHRLDRDTSGCLVFARDRLAAVDFQSALQAGRVRKRYIALLGGKLEGDKTITAPLLVLQPSEAEKRVVVDPAGKTAISHFKSNRTGEHCSQVDIEIETGRTHQIRVHARSISHPVVGDDRYGDRKLNKSAAATGHKRMFLHAVGIDFPADSSPVPATMAIEAPVDSGWLLAFEGINARAQ